MGHVWVGPRTPPRLPGRVDLRHRDRTHERGKGYGRALLRAAERETARHGVRTIGLNVFGPNTVARNLYESAGYEVASLQMHKELPPPD